MLIKASLSLLLSSSEPSRPTPSFFFWLIQVPPKSDPSGGCLPGRISGCCPGTPTPPSATGTLPGLSVSPPDTCPLDPRPRAEPPVSPRHAQARDHSLPQLPNHTYLLPPSLPLPRFCLVTERHLGTLPRLELESCTVPRNLSQAEPPGCQVMLGKQPADVISKSRVCVCGGGTGGGTASNHLFLLLSFF